MFQSELIRKKREEKGLSRGEVSILTGIPVRTLEYWEQGHEPTNIFWINELARCYGCSIQDFTYVELNIRKKKKS